MRFRRNIVDEDRMSRRARLVHRAADGSDLYDMASVREGSRVEGKRALRGGVSARYDSGLDASRPVGRAWSGRRTEGVIDVEAQRAESGDVAPAEARRLDVAVPARGRHERPARCGEVWCDVVGDGHDCGVDDGACFV